MSKSIEQVLLVPGETGWEIWTRKEDPAFTLHGGSDSAGAGDLDNLPPGDITLLFPVKSLTAVPMRVASDDDSLFPDLAAMHAERLGLRTDPMAGQLTDIFVISREQESTALLSVFLRTPGEGELPPRGPKSFDLSPRGIPVEGDTLAIWKEFGRWVFALYHQGNLAYCQATSEESPDPGDSLAREIRLSMMQLSMQGLDIKPSRILVWTTGDPINSSALRSAFSIPIETAARPAPTVPEPLSKLLPADVRAARREATRRRNITLGVAAAITLYLGLIGWFGYGLWQGMSETKKLLAQAHQIAPEGAAYADHIEKWDELAHAIDLTHSPVDILHRISTCIPPNSGLRLKFADISANQIKLQGEAPQLQAVNTFSLRLSKNNDLATFTWETPEPNQGKTGWEFVFSGDIPVVQSQP